MKILGITGGTNTGKTLIRNLFEKTPHLINKNLLPSKIKVFDADKTLARLYASDRVVIKKIASLYPDAIIDDKVNTKKLAPFYFASDDNAKKVEEITKNLIQEDAKDFSKSFPQAEIGILDVPMLTELGLHKLCDFNILVTANYEVRRQRAIDRMLEQKGYDAKTSAKLFEEIVKKQSGLSQSEREKISGKEAAQIGDTQKHKILDNSDIPYHILENSGDKTTEQIAQEISYNVIPRLLGV